MPARLGGKVCCVEFFVCW